MNWLDVVIIIILGLGLLRGFTDGLIIEVTKIAALILGIFLSIHFSGWTASHLSDYFGIQTSWLGVIAFAITFIVVVIAINLLGRLLDGLLKATTPVFVLRITGAIFGTIKMALLLSVIFIFINTINQKIKVLPEKATSESKLYNTVESFAPAIFPVIEDRNLLDCFGKNKKPADSKSF